MLKNLPVYMQDNTESLRTSWLATEGASLIQKFTTVQNSLTGFEQLRHHFDITDDNSSLAQQTRVFVASLQGNGVADLMHFVDKEFEREHAALPAFVREKSDTKSLRKSWLSSRRGELMEKYNARKNMATRVYA